MKALVCTIFALAMLTSCDREKPSPEPAKATETGAGDEAAPERGAEADGGAHAHSAHDHMKHKVLPSGEVDEEASIYQLDVEMTAHDGEPRTWEDFRGEPLLITMVYSSCTTACPLIVQEVKNILKAASKPNHSVLLVSMDPERDTPKALADMKERHDLGKSWTLVRADETDVREIAAALGIRYRQLPSGDFNHSQVITFLDRNGVIEARAEGLGPQRSAVADAMAKTAETKPPSP